jgi:hypothetical protein
MAAKKKPRPLPGNLTGKSPGKSPNKKPPKGAGFLGNKPMVGLGLNAPEVQRGAAIGGEGFANQQFNALDPAFEQLTDQQYEQIQRLQGGFKNQYTTDARGQLNQSFGGASQMRGAGNQAARIGSSAMGQVRGVGNMLANQAQRGFNNAGPTRAEQNLNVLGQQAMRAQASQVQAPQNIRNLTPSQARAAGANFVGGPNAATSRAAGANFVSGPNAATARAAGANFVSGPNAATARRVAQISQGATDVRAGGLGQALLQDATGRLQSAGRLSAQDERDVAQSTRASFAARGLATSAPAAMTEALNRDRFSRQRMAEDRAYAQEVQAGNIGRQQDNSQRQLAAIQGNQQVGTQMSLADQQAINQMRSQGYEGTIDQRQFNAGNQQQTNLSNQQATNQMRAMGYEGTIDQRQFNAGNRQQTNLSNQQATNQMRSQGYAGAIDQRQFNAGNQQQINLANQQSANQIGMANQGRDQALGQMSLQAQMANQGANMDQLQNNRGFAINANAAFNQGQLDRRDQAGNFANMGGSLYNAAGQLGLSSQQLAGNLYGDAGRLRQTGAGMMADLDPFARAVDPGMRMGQTAQGMGLDTIGQSYGNMLDLYANTGSFNINRNDSNANAWINNATAIKTGNMAAGAATQAANITAAATRAARPKWWETTLGAVGNLFSSDERLKTDIKPLGTAGSVLGLTAYEFRYKGDKKKRKGFMAQDVQKVLPDAVREFNHKDGKRLAIIPKVIGQALAEELAANAQRAA